MFTTFGIALTFLTVCPWPGSRLAEREQLAAAMAWFPLIGLLLGGLLGGGGWAGSRWLPPAVVAAGLVLGLTWLTRALHLDGLADTLDGLGGGRTPEAALRIMKDHAIGAFGAAGLVLDLLAKYSLLQVLVAAGAWREIVLFPVLGRWAQVWLAYLSPYARREGGLGEAMTTLTGGRTCAWASASGLVLAALLGRGAGLAALGAVALATWLVHFYCRRRLGGVTGDVIGAVNEVMEVLALFLLVLLSGPH